MFCYLRHCILPNTTLFVTGACKSIHLRKNGSSLFKFNSFLWLFNFEQKMQMEETKLLIIGAGPAGIAASTRLLEKGFSEFIVLEAEDRIGGRIWSTNFGGKIVDLGAQWVHGEKGNVVFEKASQLDLLEVNYEEILEAGILFIDSTGKLVSEEKAGFFLNLLDIINTRSDVELKDFNGSVGDFFNMEFQKCINDGTISKEDVPLAERFLDWYSKYEKSVDGSDSWFVASGKGLTEYWKCEGNVLWAWKNGGYHNILDILMRKYPEPAEELPLKDRLRLNKEVCEVIWDGTPVNRNGKVCVKCNDGSMFLADHVIVTVSLGVLKERFLTMFKPALPANKNDAIRGLGIGTVDKIYLKFQDRWWPEDCHGFALLWNPEDLKELHESKNYAEWVDEVFGFYEVEGAPTLLCGWIVGPKARLMEQMTDLEVSENCIALLKRFIGGKFQVPQPEAIKRSTWSKNPHFRGSYSFRSMDTELLGTSAAVLAQPVANSSGKQVLMFAGEATHDHYYSTVHGAIETGWREVDRLINMSSSQLQVPALKLCESHSVIIIGAGISGLAAAKTLVENGIKDVLVLEAQDYPGGRILSISHNKEWVEAGAQWIHGQNNDVFRIAKRNDLLSDNVSAEGLGPYLRDDGFVVDPSIVFEVDKVVSEILQECEDFVEKSTFPHSIGEHLEKKFTEYLDNCPNDSCEIREVKEQLFDWHKRFQIIDNSCTKLESLSAKAWGKYKFCGGEDYINFKGGYSTLITAIIRQLPADSVRLNKPVVKVKWKNDCITNNICLRSNCNCETSLNSKCCMSINTNLTSVSDSVTDNSTLNQVLNCLENNFPVKIVCADGDYYYAKHVIVTASLGFLKKNYENLFQPALPSKYIQTIREMGFSTINKIFLCYDNPWWSPEIKGLQLLWSEHKSLDQTNKMAWTSDLTGFDVLDNHSSVLLGWIGGKGAEIMEELSEEEIGIHCTEVLRACMPTKAIPLPQSVIKSKWHTNPYICGGYCNITEVCDISGTGPSILSEPIFTKLCSGICSQHPTLLFAGEATHENHFSTTHGAYETGQKQANVILEHHCLKRDIYESST